MYVQTVVKKLTTLTVVSFATAATCPCNSDLSSRFRENKSFSSENHWYPFNCFVIIKINLRSNTRRCAAQERQCAAQCAAHCPGPGAQAEGWPRPKHARHGPGLCMPWEPDSPVHRGPSSASGGLWIERVFPLDFSQSIVDCMSFLARFSWSTDYSMDQCAIGGCGLIPMLIRWFWTSFGPD